MCKKYSLERTEPNFGRKPITLSLHTKPAKLAVPGREALKDITLIELVSVSRYGCKYRKSRQERADNKRSYHQETLSNSEEHIQGAKPQLKRPRTPHTKKHLSFFQLLQY